MTSAAPRSLTMLRRVVVAVIIASFDIAAVLGIIVLLGFEIGDTTGKVLATTAIVGAFSVAVLCCAALLGRPAQLVGIVGAAASIVSAALVIWLVWDDSVWGDAWETYFRIMWTSITVSASFSLGSLLLLLSDRRRPVVRTGLGATLALLVLLVVLTIYLIWAPDVDEEVFPRLYGIVAILTALGAVVVPVLSLLMPDHRMPRPAGLSDAAAERIVAEAQRRGVTPDELVAALLPPDDASPPR